MEGLHIYMEGSVAMNYQWAPSCCLYISAAASKSNHDESVENVHAPASQLGYHMSYDTGRVTGMSEEHCVT